MFRRGRFVFWLPCQNHRGKGLGTVACKTTFPSSMQMAAITWPLMIILNKRLGCDFALYYSPELMYYKAETFGLVGALRVLWWLCVHFLNAELKGALYHLLLSSVAARGSAQGQRGAGAFGCAPASCRGCCWLARARKPSEVKEISFLRRCKVLMGWTG